MPRAIFAAAAGLLLALAGCETLQYLNFSMLSSTSAKEHVVTGSLAAVERTTEAALTQIGLTHAVTRNGTDEIRILCTTASRKRFFLILQRVGRGKQESTRVRVEWVDPDDGETW